MTLQVARLASLETGVWTRPAGAELVVEAANGAYARVAGRSVVSFVSANYLGIEASVCTCKSEWYGRRRGLGLPRALAADRYTCELERAITAWVCQPSAFVTKSTLHALVDLLPALAGKRGMVVLDVQAYATSHMAAELARRRGAQLLAVPHYDPEALRRKLSSKRIRPAVVLCDSWDASARAAPLPELARVCADYGATLLVDDTQGIGIFGERSITRSSPYGSRGNGSLRFLGVDTGAVVLVASMAKAFGVPVTFIAGPAPLLDRLRAEGELASAASPPDLATLRAGLHVLRTNQSQGDALRAKLADAVCDLREGAGTQGEPHFPAQPWSFRSERQAYRTWKRLLDAGVWALLRRARHNGVMKSSILFLVTASHCGPPMGRALAAIHRVREQSGAW